ncbi:MAG TPA: glycerophosphodiester phosphodiesterase family protein [Variovorax sp.]|nr:glycerophosphodiester phosphodiesterase family protein [Variovorax sp.]
MRHTTRSTASPGASPATAPAAVPAAPRRLLGACLVLAGSMLAGACGGGGSDATGNATPAAGAAPLKTLDGNVPLVVGHRGLPGLYPEQTRLAYEAAADAGADSLELDLHLTKDCVPVARHNAWLSDNTNVAQVAAGNAAVAARRRTRPGVLVDVTYPAVPANGPARYLSDRTDANDPASVLRSLVVDGEDHTGDWSISDFTLAELRQWLGGTTYDARAQRPSELNGRLPILSFQEVIDIARAKGAALGRTITVYPESKNPHWNNAQAIANGCGVPGGHPFEDAILKVMEANGLNRRDAPILVQSFDPASLRYLRSAGMQARAVQLVDGNAIDFRTGGMIYVTDDAYTFVSGRPYSWTLAGDPRFFDAMLTPAGLAEIATYADGIGPWKPQVMAHTIVPFRTSSTTSPEGTLAEVTNVAPTRLVADAHRAGLFVHTFTFRNEPQYLAGVYRGDPAAEYAAYFAAGVDGVFTDFANTAFAARRTYLATTGR